MYNLTWFRFLIKTCTMGIVACATILVWHMFIPVESIIDTPALAAIEPSPITSTPRQVAEGFENFQFPIPEIDPTTSLVGISDSNPVAAIEVAGSSYGRSSHLTTRSGTFARAFAENSQLIQTKAKSHVGDIEAVNQSDMLAKWMPGAVQDSAELVGNARYSETVDRAEYLDHLRTFRDNLGEMVYLVDVSIGDGTLPCNEFLTYLDALDSVPRELNISQNLELPAFHMQQAFESVEVAYRDVSHQCGADEGQIALNELKPIGTADRMYSNGQLALDSVFEAVLWLNGDVRKIRPLYFATRASMVELNQLLQAGEAKDCPKLNATYEEIMMSPLLDLPEGQLKNTYEHYSGAIFLTLSGAEPIYRECIEIMGGNGSGISQFKITKALNPARLGLTQLDVAIAYLPE